MQLGIFMCMNKYSSESSSCYCFYFLNIRVLRRREGSGSRSRKSGSNKNMSASACDGADRCPKPKDRCTQREHCGDPPKEKKDKKQKKKFVYIYSCHFMSSRCISLPIYC